MFTSASELKAEFDIDDIEDNDGGGDGDSQSSGFSSNRHCSIS